MTSARAEVEALRRPFRIGVIAVLAFIVAVGGIVAAFGTPADRPAGIAERWLVALSDTTRDGLEDDARERMEEHTSPMGVGSGEVVDAVLGRAENVFETFEPLDDGSLAATDGEARFETVRVGRAIDVLAHTVLVPTQVTPYEADDPLDAYVLLLETERDGWGVAGFFAADRAVALVGEAAICTGDSCPGFPLDRPERAPIGFWLGTLALGVLIAAGCSAAVRAATPKLAAS